SIFSLNRYELTPNRSVSSYSIQSNVSGPGHLIHKLEGQDCQPRGEAQIEDSRTSTITFEALIESPEAEIASIPVLRPESFPTGNSRNIPVSVQELVHCRKAAGVGTSSKSLDSHNELISSSEEFHVPRKDSGYFEGMDTHVLQRTSSTDKSLVEKPKHVVRGPEEEVGSRTGKQPSGSSPSLHKQKSASTSAKQGYANPKEQSEGQEKVKGKEKAKVEQVLLT
ncbi:hypothetical protein O181_105269, partial [Austropuccinia psidii MF-1]|nr:hypothetical protein [Austropuccinia psidii MF-1]